MRGKERKRSRAGAGRRWLLYLLLAFFIFLLLYSAYKRWTQVPLYRVQAFSQYQKVETGQATAVFYEVEASFFRGQKLDDKHFHSGNRYRIDDSLQSLDRKAITDLFRYNSELKKRLQDPNLSPSVRDQFRLESHYYDQVISRGTIFMPFSGLVFTHIDGFEPFYLPQDLNGMEKGKTMNPYPVYQQPGLKFIDNRLYYLLVNFPKSCRPRTWKQGQSYSIQVADNHYQGKLERVLSYEDGSDFLVFSLRDGFPVWADQRFQPLSVVLDQRLVYRLPVNSIFMENGLYYCYVMDSSYKARKVQVYPVDSDLESGEFILDAEKKLNPKDPHAYTMRVLDQVVEKPAGIKEGDILR